MTPEQKRKFNTASGSGFLLIGIVAWCFTGYFAMTPNPPKPIPAAEAATVDLPSCRGVLTALGYSASVQGNEVSAFEELSADPERQLERATLAMTACKLPLKSFCMGSGCERVGVNIVLAPVAPVAAAGAKAAPAKGAPARPATGAGAPGTKAQAK